MRILVFSDSHGTLEPMRRAIERFSPDTVIHLGDYVEDSAALEREYPFQALIRVRGNCDAGHYDVESEATPCWQGVRFLAVHGHRYGVKAGLLRLSYAAQEEGAQVVLFGHTHIPFCEQTMGRWFINPGACGGAAPTCAVVELQNGTVSCRIVSISEEEK